MGRSTIGGVASRLGKVRVAALASAASAAVGMLGFAAPSHGDELYWTGAGNGTTWATAGNWSTDSGGSDPSIYSPIATTTVNFDATSTVTPPTATVLGAPTSVNGISVSDSAGLVLNNDSNNDSLTVGAGGMSFSDSIAPSTITAPIIVNGAQGWQNGYSGSSSGYDITLGAVTDVNSQLTIGSFTNGQNGFVFTNAGNANASFNIGGTLNDFWVPMSVNIPVNVTASSTWQVGSYGWGYITSNNGFTIAPGTSLSLTTYDGASFGNGNYNINGGLNAIGGVSINLDSYTNLNFNSAETITGGSTAGTALNVTGGDFQIQSNVSSKGYINVQNYGGGGTLTVASGVFAITGQNTSVAGLHVLSGATFLADATNASIGSLGYPYGQSFTFDPGSELAGNGYVNGTGPWVNPVGLPGGAIVSAGNGAKTGGTTGTLNFSNGGGTLTVTAGNNSSNSTVYLWKINDASGSSGSADGWDQLALGTLNINNEGSGTIIVQAESFSDTNGDPGGMANFNPLDPHSWLIATLANGTFNINDYSLDTTSEDFGLENPGGTYSLSASGGNLYVNYTPSLVPEPASISLLGLGSLGLLARRRRGAAC